MTFIRFSILVTNLALLGCGKPPSVPTVTPQTPEQSEDAALRQMKFVESTRDESLPNRPVVRMVINTHSSQSLVKDDDLAPLREFTSLRELELHSCDVTGVGFIHLAGLKPLRSI